MNINDLLDRLDASGNTLTLDQLKDLLNDLDTSGGELEAYAHFASDKYTRNLVRRGADYEALLLCFEAGQRTPIHDHSGVACGVKVIQGVGTETAFARNKQGWIYATGSRELPAGGVVGSNDMDTHQLSNLQPDGRRLITLHIYSPPLGTFGNYSLADNTVILLKARTGAGPSP